MTERTAVNPWAWSLAFGFNQGELVAGADAGALLRGPDVGRRERRAAASR